MQEPTKKGLFKRVLAKFRGNRTENSEQTRLLVTPAREWTPEEVEKYNIEAAATFKSEIQNSVNRIKELPELREAALREAQTTEGDEKQAARERYAKLFKELNSERNFLFGNLQAIVEMYNAKKSVKDMEELPRRRLEIFYDIIKDYTTERLFKLFGETHVDKARDYIDALTQAMNPDAAKMKPLVAREVAELLEQIGRLDVPEPVGFSAKPKAADKALEREVEEMEQGLSELCAQFGFLPAQEQPVDEEVGPLPPSGRSSPQPPSGGNSPRSPR